MQGRARGHVNSPSLAWTQEEATLFPLVFGEILSPQIRNHIVKQMIWNPHQNLQQL